MKYLFTSFILFTFLSGILMHCGGAPAKSAAPADMMEKSSKPTKKKKDKSSPRLQEESDFTEEDPMSAGIKG